MSETRALVLLAAGFEELELVAPVDLLRRGGVICQIVSCEPGFVVEGRNGMRLEADLMLIDLDPDQLFDCVVVPGGPGVSRLRENAEVLALLRRHRTAERPIGAICAAPTVLQAADILPGLRFTGHHSIAAVLPGLIADQPVIVDDQIVTSRGAGTAVHFGLALLRILRGDAVADEVAASIHHQASW